MCQVSKEEGAEFIQKDIKLTEQMLSAQTEKQVEDQGRNFHCWDHRRLLLQMSDSFDLNVELGLTTRLIKSSMSNFSAWHYRSQALGLTFFLDLSLNFCFRMFVRNFSIKSKKLDSA